MSLPRKIQAFWAHFSWREKLAVPVVFIVLGAARLMVKTVPFRRYAFIFGRKIDVDSSSQLLDSAAKAADRGRVIRTVARNTPWTSNCLAQAIVAALYLRIWGVPFTAYFGVKKSDEVEGDLQAHAWVMSKGAGVTGVRESVGMTPVSAFVFPTPIKTSRT